MSNLLNSKPCPFCGGDADVNIDYNWDQDAYFIFVYCKSCGARTRTFSFREKFTDEKAEQLRYAWERRVEEL